MYTEDLWKRLHHLGLETMEDLAHACGPLGETVERNRFLELLKQMWGIDWETAQVERDAAGEPVKEVVPGTGVNDVLAQWQDKTYMPEKPVRFINKMTIACFTCREATKAAAAQQWNTKDEAPQLTDAERFARRENMRVKYSTYYPGFMQRVLEGLQVTSSRPIAKSASVNQNRYMKIKILGCCQ